MLQCAVNVHSHTGAHRCNRLLSWEDDKHFFLNKHSFTHVHSQLRCLFVCFFGANSCEIPCDSDCQVGEWSAWSPCAASACIRQSRQQQFVDKTNTMSPDDDQGDDSDDAVDGQVKQKQKLRDINQGTAA